MPFPLSNKNSSKSLAKTKAPLRNVRLHPLDKKPEVTLKKIRVHLDGLVSTLMKDGSWCVEHEMKEDASNYHHQLRMSEKLTKENELLKRRNEILLDLAKTKTAEVDEMETELRKLRKIVKKCAPTQAAKEM